MEDGKPDSHGRVMLQDWELGLAVNHALSYIQPDEILRDAIAEGRMKTRDDVQREVLRMLADDSIRKPRVLRFSEISLITIWEVISARTQMPWHKLG